MKSEDENMELEKEAPNLTAISKENAFETPNGYFNNLTEQINSQVKITQLVAKTNDFDTPAGYFENLDQQIQSRVSLDNLKANDFNVPANYFADSQKRIQNSVITKSKKSNVIKLHFIRYAAAACILLTTTLGVYINIKHSTTVDYQLSKIPVQEIESYLNQHTDGSDLPMLIESIDDANLSIDDFELENTN